MKIQKISSYALYACFAIAAVCFAVFYLVGYDNMEGEYVAPQFTELLLWLMYAFVAINIVLMVWSGVKSVMVGAGVDDAKTGVPGTKVAWAAIGCLIAAVVIGMVFGTSAPVTTVDGTVTEGFLSYLSDIMIIAIYVLAAIAAIGIIYNLCGFQKK